MSWWALLDASKNVVGQVVTVGDARPSVAEAGFASAVRTARQADLSVERIDPSTGAITEDAAKVEALLVGLVKVEAERRKMERATAGGYKKTEYAAKEREVAAWDALGATAATILAVFQALAPAQQAARFPYAVASAALFKDTPAAAIERFRAGIARAAQIPRFAAIEEAACAAIRTATTAAAKRAAYAAINWS